MRSETSGPTILVVDVGDIVTKALLFEMKNGQYRIKGISEVETTVEPPNLDVTKGVTDAIKNLE